MGAATVASAQGVCDPLTLLEPSGQAVTNTPTYQWVPSAGATWYQLWVNDSNGNAVNRWYTAEQVGAASGTAAVTPGDLLSSGNARWWVRAWSSEFGFCPWYGPLSFQVGGDCGVPSPLAPFGSVVPGAVEFSWQPVDGATWYQLWVSGPSGIVVNRWYTAAAVGAGSGVARVVPEAIFSGGGFNWWVRSWSSGTGNCPWSAATEFSVGLPVAPEQLSPLGGVVFGPLPTFRWQPVANATWYQLEIVDFSGSVTREWFTAEEVGADSGVSSVVSPVPLPSGDASWRVRAWSDGVGSGPWSLPVTFTVKTCDDSFEWAPGFQLPGVSGTIHAMTIFQGLLHVGGEFTVSTPTGQVSNLARWDGRGWSSLGAAIQGGAVLALAVFEEPGGPRLFVGGNFTGAGAVAQTRAIARWNGVGFSSVVGGVPTGAVVQSLTAGIDPSTGGSALFVGGTFTSVGAGSSLVLARNIARWNGVTWAPLGPGLGGANDSQVRSIAFYQGNLFAGGTFTEAGATIGSNPVSQIARWTGSAWLRVGPSLASNGTSGPVNTMTVFDGRLYVGGAFLSASGAPNSRNVASWNGVQWAGVTPGGIGAEVLSLGVFDPGTGPRLFAGGSFLTVNGTTPARRIAQLGPEGLWSPLFNGFEGDGADGPVRSLAVFDAGFGPDLVVGGNFQTVGGTTASDTGISAGNIARWTGEDWAAFGAGLNGTARALTVVDDGAGETTFVAGDFTRAGGRLASRIARWQNGVWRALGSGLSGTGASVRTVAAFDDGGGLGVYVGGTFTVAGGESVARIARWDVESEQWERLGNGIFGGTAPVVNAIAVFDGALYAGGVFNNAGAVQASSIARWNGQNWSALGVGVAGTVSALAVFDDGSGPALYVAGQFTNAGGVAVSNIARWDGQSWSAVGAGIPGGQVYSLTVFDDGAGAALFAGGQFSAAGSVVAQNIARWNGESWSGVGTGVSGSIRTLTVFNDGIGDALYVGGFVTAAGGQTANRVARWDGFAWSPLGDGFSSASGTPVVWALAGGGGGLVAGGEFSLAGGVSASRLAVWTCGGP
jgi:hypothetical protein